MKILGQKNDRIERPASADRHLGNSCGTPNSSADLLDFEFLHRLDTYPTFADFPPRSVQCPLQTLQPSKSGSVSGHSIVPSGADYGNSNSAAQYFPCEVVEPFFYSFPSWHMSLQGFVKIWTVIVMQ